MSKALVPQREYTTIVVSAPDQIEDWLQYCKDADSLAPASIRAYHRGIRVFTGWLLEQGIGDVTPKTMISYRGWLAERFSLQTTNMRLVAVRSFYRWQVITEQISVSPASQIKGLKQSPTVHHKRELLSDEVLAVLDTCNSNSVKGIRDRAIISLMAYCALRTIEVHRANLGNLVNDRNHLVLWVHGKGRLSADEVVVIPPHQEHAIREWLKVRKVLVGDNDDSAPLFISLSRRNEGQRLQTRPIRGMVSARFDEAGIIGSRKSTHSLRHSAITSAIRHGADPMAVMSMARHRSFNTTLKYFHAESRMQDPAECYISYGEEK